MTEVEKRAYLTEATGESEQSTLTAYLKMAENIVINRTYPFGNGSEVMPPRYEFIQIQIAVYLLNKRGAEGEISHSENGITRIFSDGDIPPTLLRQITPMGVIPS